VTTGRKQTVLDHLVGSQSEAFRGLEEKAKELGAKSTASSKGAELAEHRLDEVRQAQFTTKDMADTLTRDLARVYGKDHLSVAVTEDGKSYACRRGDKPGTDLSDGERTTLSLLYFLRKLEDEQVPGGDPLQRIVVIDDPSSSLDREALFATHQWLVDTLKGFGQYVVLRHDFSLLRLFIKSHRNAWGKSMKQINDGNADEARFPRVAFLEMYAAVVDGERRSKVGKLPRLLLNNTSEYAYLFSMIMAGIAGLPLAIILITSISLIVAMAWASLALDMVGLRVMAAGAFAALLGWLLRPLAAHRAARRARQRREEG